MEWLQIIVLMGGNLALIIPLWLWNRSESNNDRREIMSILKEMKEEMKDFHGRLLVLEDRYLRLREKE